MAYNNVKVKPRQTVAQSTSQTKDLGIISEVPMGEWDATTQYQKLNKVRYVSMGGSGVTLLAKKQNQGIEPFVSQGWQEVWMVENYDGGSVSPDGTYPEMTVGNSTNAQNDGNGVNIVEQFSDINDKIPSSASAENQLADKAFVNSSINNLAAFYITSNAQGDAFPTRAALLSATTFYSGGEVRVPTQNDYAIVRADESQPLSVDGSYPTTRYSYQGGTYPNGQWDFQYIVNNTSLTQAQVNAINSGITAEKITAMDNATAGKYTKPSGGIPETDLSENVQSKLNASSNGYIKNLYNLGAYDIFNDNASTVSRKTGYRTYRSYDVSLANSQTNIRWYSIPKPFDYKHSNDYSGEMALLVSKYEKGGTADINSAANIGHILPVFEASKFWVGFAPNTTLEQAQQAIDGLVMQYELAASYQYTQQVIKNQIIGNTDGILQIDPTTLEPTTANGWTVGSDTLTLPSVGVYLISIDSSSPTIVVYDGDNDLLFVSYASASGYNLIHYYRTGSRKWVGAKFYDPNNAPSPGIQRVAYKKLV